MAAPILPYLARLGKTAQNLRSEDDKESRNQFHYETVISILKINSWHFAEILDLKVPIIKEEVVAFFKILSSILSPEDKLGHRYEYIQLALDSEQCIPPISRHFVNASRCMGRDEIFWS